MAIEITHIYSTDNSGLLAWLQANAVPTYFDRVETDEETSGTIHCYVGEHELLKIEISKGSYPDIGFYIINADSTITPCAESTTTAYYAGYGYKTACGLAIGIAKSTDHGVITNIPIFITKDSADNTVIVSSKNMLSQSGYVSAITAVDTVVNSITFTQVTGAAATTIVPFVCGNSVGETRYTPNAFYMPTAQYTTIGKLMINGVTYLTNGVWLLKDA